MKQRTWPRILFLVFITYFIAWMAQRMMTKWLLQPTTVATSLNYPQTEKRPQVEKGPPIETWADYSKYHAQSLKKPRLFVALHQCKNLPAKHIVANATFTGLWNPCQQPRKRIYA